MASNRNHAADQWIAGQGAATPGQPPEQMLDEAVRKIEDAAKRDRKHDPAAPRAGRTGGLGARAERPSEGRQPLEQPASGPRGGKPPAPRACK